MCTPGIAAGDERSRAIQEILARTYEATSSDGQVTIRVIGDAKVASASVHEQIDPSGTLSRSATEAVQSSLHEARAETARAMADLPGLNPQLRALLLGDS